MAYGEGGTEREGLVIPPEEGHVPYEGVRRTERGKGTKNGNVTSSCLDAPLATYFEYPQKISTCKISKGIRKKKCLK